MGSDLPSASLLENARLNSLVFVPNAIRGIFRPRPAAVLAATKADADRWALGLLEGIRRAHAPGPVWVRVVRDPALLVLSREDVRAVLDGAPEPFAIDPEAKRKGMGHFQPGALTISRDGEWRSRRAFAEAVLDTGEAHHRFAGRFDAVVREEAEALLAEARAELRWAEWHLAFRRITRRVVLGDAARDDEALTDLLAEMMDSANGMPGEPHERVGDFTGRIRAYLEAAEPESLAAAVASAPQDDATLPERQLTHWLFASGDTLAANAFRALALLATHPGERERALADERYLGGCLSEAMRLWPTTPLLSRLALRETRLPGGAVVPEGAQLLISNLLNHRDRDTIAYADRFAPGEWVDGDAASEPYFEFFSSGPAGCPGAGLAQHTGRAVLARVLGAREVRYTGSELEPGRSMPHMLDFFRLRFELS
jgi:cytochrome P450